MIAAGRVPFLETNASMPQPDLRWTCAFSESITSGDLDGAIAILDTMKTAHAGTAPQAVKHAAIAQIRKAYRPDSDRTCAAGLALAISGSATAREIGISLLPPFYAAAPIPIDDRFLRTGDDASWEVREWAASALAHVISGHFDLVHPRLHEWTAHPSPNVRRMVVVAAGYAMRDCTTAQCRQLLDLLASVMADADPYVSRNLGAFALGSYAIRYQPELVAEWAPRLALDDERTARNLAMMFTTAEGARQAERFSELLARLAKDDRTRVRTAIRKATANLAKRTGNATTTGLKRSGES